MYQNPKPGRFGKSPGILGDSFSAHTSSYWDISHNILRMHPIGGSRGACRAHAPLWDPILSFLHTFSPKSGHIGGPRPPNGVHAPPTGNPRSATASYTHNFISVITAPTAQFCMPAGTLNNIYFFTLNRFARNFIDMVGRDVDVEAQKLLASLRDDKLVQKLPECNVSRFEVRSRKPSLNI